MGAFLFSAQPPFRVVAMSTAPLVNQSMYSGSWADPPFSFYHLDYTVFPTNLLLDPQTQIHADGQGQKGQGEEGTQLLLTYGRQELETWVASLELQGLVDSMSWQE